MSEVAAKQECASRIVYRITSAGEAGFLHLMHPPGSLPDITREGGITDAHRVAHHAGEILSNDSSGSERAGAKRR